MATPQQTPYARIPVWLRELQFVTDFFSWLFAFCSRLAEPFMLICTLYIVAEAGVPVISLPALHNLAIGIMITAPELILPGAFVVAAQAQEHARLLFAVCWTFVALTLITLISLFVWHFTGASLAWLMCARCATAVGYSILMRVMHHEHQCEQTVIADRTASDHSNTEGLNHLIEQVQGLSASVGNVSMSVTELRSSVTKISTSPTPVALPMPATTSEYIAFNMGDQVVAGATTHSDYALFEYGVMSDEGLDFETVEQDLKPRLLLTATTASDQSDGSEQGATRATSTSERIRLALMHQPNLSDREVASLVGCSNSTVNKWRRRIEVA